VRELGKTGRIQIFFQGECAALIKNAIQNTVIMDTVEVRMKETHVFQVMIVKLIYFAIMTQIRDILIVSKFKA